MATLVLKRLVFFIVISTLILQLAACDRRSFQPEARIAEVTSLPEGVITSSPQVRVDFTSPTQANPVAQSLMTATPTGLTKPQTTQPATAIPPVQSTSTPLLVDNWMSLPVIPEVSQTAKEIYQRGFELGRDPHAFSKIGDCQSITTYFLASFDHPGQFNLGTHTYLQEALDWFAGSFSRQSMSVKGGFNAAAVLSPLRADAELCQPDENPIQCEFRLHNPSIAIISLEEWWTGHPENYEKYMRQIIEYSIAQGVVPIIATKADNLEGDHLINQTIARLASEYDIPLWNFWLAVQPLPNHGLIAKDSSGNPDMFHLTHRANYYFFNNRVASRSGMSVRNLTALQALDAVWRGLNGQMD